MSSESESAPPHVEVDRDIYVALAELRERVETTFDIHLRDNVIARLRHAGDDEAADWVEANRAAYAQGVVHGFYARPRSGLPLLQLTKSTQDIDLDDLDD